MPGSLGVGVWKGTRGMILETVIPLWIHQPDLIPKYEYDDGQKYGYPIPEMEIMAAILEYAVGEAHGKGPCKGSREKMQREAIEWFQCTSHEDIYSFENICNVLDLDAQAIREVALGKDGLYAKEPETPQGAAA